MNYVKLINSFWELRRREVVTNLQADLYFFILHESNSRGNGKEWENPFRCANQTIQATIGIAKSSLQDARERLVDLGLIIVDPGIKNKLNPGYFITGGMADNRPNFRPSSGQTFGQAPDHIIEEKQKRKQKRKPKQNFAEQSPAEKNNIIIHNHEEENIQDTAAEKLWPKVVEAWFEFYKDKKQETPTFNAAQGKILKSIMSALQKKSVEKQTLWSDDIAVRTFQKFLRLAWEDPWLQANFLLKNLFSHFDKIILTKSNGTNQSSQPVTGSSVQISSAFAKIDLIAPGSR